MAIFVSNKHCGVSQHDLCARLDYNLDTGALVWKNVGPDYGKFWRRFNKLWANRDAGHIDAHGYRVVRWGNTQMYAHRMIWAMMTGEWPSLQIDHANGCRSDNRWINLRLATHNQNMANLKALGGKSRYSGVTLLDGAKPWVARVTKDGVRHYAGRHRCETAAAVARDRLAQKLHGEFCRLNLT